MKTKTIYLGYYKGFECNLAAINNHFYLFIDNGSYFKIGALLSDILKEKYPTLSSNNAIEKIHLMIDVFNWASKISEKYINLL